MGTLHDIVCKQNIIYNVKRKSFEDKNDLPAEIIAEPVIVMDTLHSCFSHAIMDSVFPIFWVIDDLLKAGKIVDANIRIFIREKMILQYPRQNLPMIDHVGQTYNGVFKDIIHLITPFPLFFEHTLTKNYIFQNCFLYPENNNDRWQRTPWNCVEYYSERRIPRNEIRFSDDIIYSKLTLFRNNVFIKTGSQGSEDVTPKLMIIDRKHNRKIDPIKLQDLVDEGTRTMGSNFTGVVLLEDKTFPEQVQLFANHNIFIFRHGSALINLLWIPNNSTVIELEGGPEGIISRMVIPRICQLTNSKHILLNYNDYDCKRDIFSMISSE